MIKFSLADADRIREKFERSTKKLETKLEKELATVVENIKNDSIMEAPVDTGALRRSIGSRKVKKNTFEVQAGAPYAPYVHNGTRRIRANPFLHRAVNRNRASIKRAAKRASGNLL